MRVISGSAKGRRLAVPKGMRVRPTSDRVKEALFSILNGLTNFGSCHVLDIFAGSGNLGIEALSRGALSATFIDNHRESTLVIAENLESCGLNSFGTILRRDAVQALQSLSAEGGTYQLLFLDAPYDKGLTEKTLMFLGESDVVDTEGIVVAEVSAREQLQEAYGKLSQFDRREYGDTAIYFFSIPEK